MEHCEETVPVPRTTRFPVELRPPAGFRPDEPATWPRVEGNLEYVSGRLCYMPPCGDIQQDVVPDVLYQLLKWREQHQEYVVGGNEAGMLIGRDVRGADAAVWRRADVGPSTGKYRRVPPLLAVEVAGQDEGEPDLRDKARWYLDVGVEAVWLVLPEMREVVVLTRQGESRHAHSERLPPHPSLPDLAPEVSSFFAQL